MAELNPKVGQTIQTADGRQGIIRYAGPLHMGNISGDWYGLELPDNSGKNDGSVKGERYFQCAPGYGIFVRKESVAKILKQAASTPRPNGATPTPNGTATKSRPSSVMPADVARKRQSMMSGGSGSTAGSRLSVRSPTKSPTKAVSSASSTASTPRTGTPATTARTSDSSTKSRLSTTARTSMAPPPAPAKTSTPGSRASIGGAPPRTSTKPSSTPARQSLSGSRLSLQSKAATQPPKRLARPAQEDDSIKSPTIEEDEGEDERQDDAQNMDSRLREVDQPEIRAQDHADPEPLSPSISKNGTVSVSRTTAASVESRAADKRENEQLKAKIRTLEKKAMENRDKMKTVDALQAEKDKFEAIIQALQKKMKTHSQDMAGLKSKYEEAEQRAVEGQTKSAEHDSELELAKLDKEMAEERANMYDAELETLKIRLEEQDRELQDLKEENRELGSAMSPEDKANAGWIQMEKEQERLRQALRLLRDASQANESELKAEIKELQETLDEMEVTITRFSEVSEKLARTEETNKHLMEQLEVAEASEDVVIAMEAQREQSSTIIERQRKQIQDFEEHIQVTDELESFHVEEEKRLHHQLDESEALLNDKHRQTIEQEKVIEDLEYTLLKFRDVVQGLQSDINELRRSRDISELEAHEMSSKSRAMMDLNLQLQNSASKTQLKTIDFEIGKMHADQAVSHLGIVQLFMPETFDGDRNPVLALLCFKRINAKAELTKNLLSERMRDRPHLAQDDPFMIFEVMEKMGLIVASCDRSIQFISTASTQEFGRYAGALYELEPVERSVTGWIEALKRDELGGETPDILQRVIGILQDMAEKLISETEESRATELVVQSRMVESFTDSCAQQLSAIIKAVQSKLGNSTEEDEASQVFDKKLDQLSTRARTIKYVSGKVTQLLTDLRSGSMCLGETTWVYFEEAETVAENIATLIREVGRSLIAELSKFERDEPLSYRSIINTMMQIAQKTIQAHDPGANIPDDVFTLLGAQLQGLQSKVDDLQNKAADINSATEFESRPPPWTIRAKEIKAQKVISQDTQDELTRLKAKAQEQVLLTAEKEKMMEEQQIRIDLLESRSKEARAKDADAKALKDEIEKIKAEKIMINSLLEKSRTDHDELLGKRDADQAELEALKMAAVAEGGAAVVSRLGDQSETTRLLRVEVDMLHAEIVSLQAAVRYLQTENQSLRVPVGELATLAERNAWLSPEYLARRKGRAGENTKDREALRGEGDGVLEGLIELAGSMKPVRLRKPGEKENEKGWRRMMETTRWQVARQREEVENWAEWRNEVLRKGRLETRSTTGVRGVRKKMDRATESKAGYSLPDSRLSDDQPDGKRRLLPDGEVSALKQVRIVDGAR